MAHQLRSDSFGFRLKAESDLFLFLSLYCAGVAELADALDLGSSVFDVGVQVPPPALCFVYCCGSARHFCFCGRGGMADALG